MSLNQHLGISKWDTLGRESCMSHDIISGFCQFTPDQRVPVVMVHAIQPAGLYTLRNYSYKDMDPLHPMHELLAFAS